MGVEPQAGQAPDALGRFAEGPAVSRSQLRIAWAQHRDAAYGEGAFYHLKVAELDYSSGEPTLVNARVVLDNQREAIKRQVLEPQNSVRPGARAYGPGLSQLRSPLLNC